MRNRAKCKLCESVIESLHRNDYVMCKCGEITVDGGQDYFKCSFKNAENFFRVDDEDNIIYPKFVNKEPSEPIDDHSADASKEIHAPTRSELLDMLDAMAKSIESLPQQAMTLPITHYDHYSLILLLSSILRSP